MGTLAASGTLTALRRNKNSVHAMPSALICHLTHAYRGAGLAQS